MTGFILFIIACAIGAFLLFKSYQFFSNTTDKMARREIERSRKRGSD